MLTVAKARRAPRPRDTVMAAGAPVGKVGPVIVKGAAVGERGVSRGTTCRLLNDVTLALDEPGDTGRERRCGEGDDWENKGESAHVGRWDPSLGRV